MARSDGGQSVVLVNEGLVLADQEGSSFLCPALWGDVSVAAGKLPLALSVDGIHTWIIGSDDLYLAKDGTFTPQGRPDLGRNSIVALDAMKSQVFGLRIGAMGSEIVRIGAEVEPPIWTSPDYWGALAVDGDRFVVARVVNEREIGFVIVDAQGQAGAETRAIVTTMISRIDIRPTAAGLYAVVFDGNIHYTLGSLADGRWQIVMEGDLAIQGPQMSADGQLWIAIDGKLQKLGAAGSTPVEEARFITCLDQWGGQPYACVGSELYWLSEQGLGERAFDLAELSSPDPALVPMGVAEACRFQWQLFRNDLELSGLTPREWVSESPTGGGPAVAAGAGGASSEPPVAAAGGASGAAGAAAACADPSCTPAQPRARTGCGGCSATPASSPITGAQLLAPAGLLLLLAARLRRARRMRP